MEPVQPKKHGRDVELDVLGRPVLVARFDRREPRRHVGLHLVPSGVVRGVAVAAARPVEGLLELPRALLAWVVIEAKGGLANINERIERKSNFYCKCIVFT